MIKLLRALYAKRYPLFLFLFLLAMNLSILIDIPVFRQILSLAFLIYVPGFLFLDILKLNKLGLEEKIVLSVGLSISFSMFAGLFINWAFLVVGYERPLSTNPLLIIFSIITLILAAIAFKKMEASAVHSTDKLSNFNLDTKEKALLLIPSVFPLLGILGMHLMNTTNNNIMLVSMLFLIPAYISFIAIKHKQVPNIVYPLGIIFISISLLLPFALLSNHIYGSDSRLEYYLFQQTLSNQHWKVLMNSTVDTCLSVTLLPTVYQSFLNIKSEYIFKIIFPFLLCFTPLVVYIISKKYISNFQAFLASLFLMSQGAFFFQTAAYRNYIAILFFALAIMVLFHNELNDFAKRLLFIIFIASTIVSHYSTTYIFFIILVSIWLEMQIIHKINSFQRKPRLLKNSSSKHYATDLTSHITILEAPQFLRKHCMTIGMLILFFVMLFFWYSQITGTAFTTGVNFIINILSRMNTFFILETRDPAVLEAFGSYLEGSSALYYFKFIIYWLSIIFIAIGISITLVRYRYLIALRNEEKRLLSSDFVPRKLDAEFFYLAFTCSILFAVSVIVPYIFINYSLGRAYYQMMIVLSPFFVIGGIVSGSFIHVKWKYLMVLVVLISIFMNSTGILAQICGSPISSILNSPSDVDDIYYIYDSEISSGKWLKNNVNTENLRVYTGSSGLKLICTALIPPAHIDSYELAKENNEIKGGYIYLTNENIVKGKIRIYSRRGWEIFDMAKYQNNFYNRNLIYSNGDSEVLG